MTILEDVDISRLSAEQQGISMGENILILQFNDTRNYTTQHYYYFILSIIQV